ncbi:MAG: hypothetical protein GY847_41905 [Proteobacteria bacterium]|nr:hypothetical protein [Pseudomonadota bacterium]
MTIFDQIEKIDEYIDQRRFQESEDVLLASGGGAAGFGFSAGSNVPWNQTSPWATSKDSDFDGIPDALDDHRGPGKGPSGSTPPWDQNSPWAMEKDSDFDGIPDALDDHLGPGK